MASASGMTLKTTKIAVTVAGALTGLAVALKDLRDKAAALLGVPEQWIGYFGIIIAVGFVSAFWIWPPVWQWLRRMLWPQKPKHDFFRLDPYGSSDRATFVREDKEHERILNWICGAQDPILYLAGASGSGKSSLLHAYVVPELTKTHKHVCVTVRGVREPLQQIRRDLLLPDAVWRNPKDDPGESPAALAQRAATHLSGADHRLYIVFDQFEELLILHERSSPEVKGVLEFIKAVTVGDSGSVPTILLVMRSDFEGRVRELGLPAERMGENKEVVRLVSEPHAEAFLERGEVEDAAIRGRLVREASNLEETRGKLRFITLNFLGLAAAEAPRRLRRGLTGRGLLRGTVRDWVTEPAVREQADAVLRPMISEEETKKPLSLAEIAKASGLRESEVARVLMQFERDGLVRRLQNETDIWEISHDFVARLLQRVLDDLRGSLLVRARPWVGAAVGFAILLVLAGVGTTTYVHYLRAYDAWQIAQGKVWEFNWGGTIRKIVSFDNRPAVTNATLKYLAYLPERREVTVLNLDDTTITIAGLKEITRKETGLAALTDLRLSGKGMTNATMKELAREGTGLKALTHLRLTNTSVTEEGLKELAREGTGLKALTHLWVDGTPITDAAEKAIKERWPGISMGPLNYSR